MSNVLKMAAVGGAVSAETDPNFNQTVLLLHGDGTNGAQNNTFLDSSSNNFTITRNGNTTQGTFSPFSVGAGEWSNYFDGTGDYLTVPDNAAWAFGSGDFTLEAWFYREKDGTQFIVSQQDNSSAPGSAWIMSLNSSSQLRGILYYGNNAYDINSSTTVPKNQWVHIAAVRTSSTFSLFENGVRVATTNVSTSAANDSAQTVAIGARNNGNDAVGGYLSNVRVIKGSGPYNATQTTLTVPTAPLTAISNTQLLTCQSNRFVDNSTNAFAITRNGDVRVTPFSPFAPSAAYSASTNGGSGYFDGTGDVLSVADNAALEPGSSNFCIEGWYYPLSFAANLVLVGKRANTTSTASFVIYANSGGGSLLFYASTNGSTYFLNGTTVGTIVLNQWNHFAVYRVGNDWYGAVNGVVSSMGASSSGIFDNSESIRIGGDSNGNYANGYISNARIVIGSSVYTSANFTPPTAPLTAISNTSLLLNFTNAGIFDNTGKNNLETVGDAQIDTTTKKYGTGSMEFDGTGDWLTIPPAGNINLDFGTGDFTVECWFYANSLSASTYAALMGFHDGVNTSSWAAYVRSNGVFIYGSGGTLTGSGTVNTSTWYHFAATRSGSTVRVFLNGTQQASATVSGSYVSGGALFRVGDDNAASNPEFNGFIDDLRITKGVARYTANFTAPTKEFPDQ
jgi:hypothetical protein